MLFGFDAEMTGERHEMQRGAVYTATHRALKKLLDADELAEARVQHAEREDARKRRAVRDFEASSEGEA